MTTPTQQEIEEAFRHGQWLRSCGAISGTDRMLADLSDGMAAARTHRHAARTALAKVLTVQPLQTADAADLWRAIAEIRAVARDGFLSTEILP
jgi:hypothetical protein